MPQKAMRRLLLLRHAKAERSAPGASDHERALIERGRKDAVKIGAYMAGHALIPGPRAGLDRGALPADLESGVRRL